MANLLQALAKIRRLRLLTSGWNYGKGGRPSDLSTMNAKIALGHLHALGADRFDILPSDGFGIVIMASHTDTVAEIIVDSRGLFDLIIERAEDVVAEGQSLTFGALVDALEAQGWQSIKSSGSRTHTFTVWSIGDSQAQLLKSKVLVHQSSAPIVARKRVGHCVPMSRASIADWAASPPFSSDFQSRPLVTEVA